MDGMKAVRLPRDRPHRTRVPQDRVRRQRHRSREPGYPRKSNLPGIQEIAWLVRDPCPQQSASSDPPANHSRDSHETRRFYTVWVKRVASTRSRCARHVRLTSDNDRLAASQQTGASCQKQTSSLIQSRVGTAQAALDVKRRKTMSY